MGSKSGGQIIGYNYFIGLHLLVADSSEAADANMAITEIIYGDRSAWTGNQTTNGQITLAMPELFGGKDREGGIAGSVDVLFGGAAQATNSYLLDKAGTPQPAYRGVVSLVMRGIMYAANNPYLKDLSIRYERFYKHFYAAKAKIGSDANPAHMIYECWTNTRWGEGYPESRMNQSEFMTAADTLYAEGFGLSFDWDARGPVERFIQELLDHIGAFSQEDPATGLVGITLIRGGYSVGSLPVLDANNSELVEFQRIGWGETFNEIVLEYTDAESGETKTITDHNIANIQVQAGVVTKTVQYRGILTDSLAARVLSRDLKVYSSALARGKIEVNRSAWNYKKGDLFVLNEPNIGISSLVCRIGEIDRGTHKERKITIDFLEDIFGLSASNYLQAQPTGWVDPNSPPAPAAPRRLVEAPYWDIARTLSAADLATVDATDCFLESFAGRTHQVAFHYHLYSKAAAATDYSDRGIFPFCPNAVLLTAMGQQISTTISFGSPVDVDLVGINDYAYIDNEVVEVTALNLVSQSITCNRGMLDTVPVSHAAGGLIFFADGFQGLDRSEYTPGATVNARMLTTTGQGTLALASAPTDNLVMQQRQYKPYPPGNLKINGLAYPISVPFGDLTFTWSHRDRLTQLASLVSQSTANIGPETAVTYTVRIYGETNVLQRTLSAISTTSLVYTQAEDIADSGLGRPNNQMRIEVESVRSTVVSLNRHSVQFLRS